MTDAVAIEQRDDAIVGALVAGRSVRVVQNRSLLPNLTLHWSAVFRSILQRGCGRSGLTWASSID